MSRQTVMNKAEYNNLSESLKEEVRKAVDERITHLTPVTEFQWNLLERVVRVEEELKAQRNLMEDRFETLVRMIDQKAESSDKRFDLMERRFEQVEIRFEQIDKRFELVEKRFELIDKRFEQIDKRFEELRDDINKRFSLFSLILLLGIPAMTGAIGFLGYTFLS